MTKSLKSFVYSLLAYSGFYAVWKKLNPKSIVFLTIHGVMDVEDSIEWTPTRPQISTGLLGESVKLIKKHYRFISLKEAVDMLSGVTPFQSHCVVLTFDDGYRNNFTHAWPVLSKYEAPAILFAAVGHVERRQCFWFDRLDYAIQQHVSAGAEFCELGGSKIPLDSSSRNNLQASIKSVIFKVKELSGSEGEAMGIAESAISKMEQLSGRSLNDLIESDPWCGVLSWSEVVAASNSGMDIGSHTVDHSRVGLMDTDAARWQLKESKEMIEEKLGQPCDYFCYPNGSLREDTIPLVREAGYRAALTTVEGLNYPGDDLYKLKRMHLPQGRTPEEALAVASGFSYKLSRFLAKMRGRET